MGVMERAAWMLRIQDLDERDHLPTWLVEFMKDAIIRSDMELAKTLGTMEIVWRRMNTPEECSHPEH